MTKNLFVLVTMTTILAAAMTAGCGNGGSTAGQFAPEAQIEGGANAKPLAPAAATPAPTTR